ncbi:MAG TPA: protoporphyrinogen oxidase [Acidobacteriota bacterium]|nr:protoporphyrinogen oxidase [Acidobacteriota bacterium]
MSSRKRVAVVGAGISGLSAAYYLAKEAEQKGFEMEVDLFEKSDRLGGVIRTEKSGEFLFEWGPENFVPYKPEAMLLAKELGLGDELIGSNDHVRQTCVVHQGQLYPLPDGMAFLAPVRVRPFMASTLLSTPGKLRAILEPFVPRSRGEITIRAFLERRLGKELTERVAEPLVSAIYGGDVDQLSTASALPDMYRIEQKYGSLWNGLRRQKKKAGGSNLPFFMTLRSGMQTLVEALVQALPSNIVVHTGVAGLRLEQRAGGFWLRDGHLNECYESLIVCVPAHGAAELLSSVSPETAAELASIHYTSTSLIYLGYKRSEFSHPLRGFGFVTPEGESQVLDACTWVSTKFEGRCPEDSVLLRCAVHDGRRPRTFPSNEEVAERAHQEVSRLLSISSPPCLFRVTHLGKCMPQMTLGHSQKLHRISQELQSRPGLFLTGPFYHSVGIPDCIRSARQTVSQVLEYLTSQKPPRQQATLR